MAQRSSSGRAQVDWSPQFCGAAPGLLTTSASHSLHLINHLRLHFAHLPHLRTHQIGSNGVGRPAPSPNSQHVGTGQGFRSSHIAPTLRYPLRWLRTTDGLRLACRPPRTARPTAWRQTAFAQATARPSRPRSIPRVMVRPAGSSHPTEALTASSAHSGADRPSGR